MTTRTNDDIDGMLEDIRESYYNTNVTELVDLIMSYTHDNETDDETRDYFTSYIGDIEEDEYEGRFHCGDIVRITSSSNLAESVRRPRGINGEITNLSGEEIEIAWDNNYTGYIHIDSDLRLVGRAS